MSSPTPEPLEPVKYWVVAVFLDGVRFTGRYHGAADVRPILHEVKVEVDRTKMLQTRIPISLHTWFKGYCAGKNISMKDQVLAYIRYLKDKDSKSNTVEVEQR